MSAPLAVAVTEASQVGEVRRAAVALAASLGFNETDKGKVALVATEAAGNLVKHAREGLVLLAPLEEGSSVGVELLALDRGPGMADLKRCLSDGYSSVGTLGAGLGAILRLSTTVDIYTQPSGTAILARLWSPPPPPQPTPPWSVAGVSVPKSGEVVCGDAWATAQVGGRQLLLVADGLGHGPLAADASRAAVRVFRDAPERGPVGILETAHRALRGGRGAAVAVAEVDLARETVSYAGVGNIAGTVVFRGASRSLLSHNGTIGLEARKIAVFAAPFPPGALLVMHSDGLGSRWTLDAYPGLAARDPALVAGILFRDFKRGRDDATVVAAGVRGGASPNPHGGLQPGEGNSTS